MCIGVNLGLTALHPLTGSPVPVFAADYVMSEYGTRAVMGVPAHDSRDRLFAEQHHLPSMAVIDCEGVLTNSDRVCSLSGH